MAHLHISHYMPSTMLNSEDATGECPAVGLNINCSNDTVKQSIGMIPTYFSIASCSLSCLGSLLIFLSYFTLKGIRNVAQKIITLLAVADFFTALGYLIADWNYLRNSDNCGVFRNICKVQSFVTSWSSICSFGWTCVLAVHFYLVLQIKRKTLHSKFLVWQNVVIWIFPLLILLPLLADGKLGYSPYATSNWCFIRRKKTKPGVNIEEIALMLIGGKFWEIISYVLVVIMYTLTNLKFHKHVSG